MTDLIAELAEVVRLGSLCQSMPYNAKRADAYKDAAFEALEFIRTHHAEIEAMARDAARYRFIRSSDADADQPYVARHGQTDWGKFYDQWLMEDDADNAIDQAMRDSAREGGE